MEEVYQQVNKGNIVLVNWIDDLPPQPLDGHSSIIAGYNKREGNITLIDPSRRGLLEVNSTFTHKVAGIWKPSIGFFEERWFDRLGEQNQPGLKIDKPMIWINPDSLRPIDSNNSI